MSRVKKEIYKMNVAKEGGTFFVLPGFFCGWLVGWRLVRDKDLVFCLFGLFEDPCARTCDEAKRFCLKVHLSTTW